MRRELGRGHPLDCCFDYAFRKLGIPWNEDFDELRADPISWLREQGFIQTSAPGANDLVTYSTKRRPKDWNWRPVSPPYIQHVGVYKGKYVLSKFGNGPIYRHDLTDVLPIYGKMINFFTKRIES